VLPVDLSMRPPAGRPFDPLANASLLSMATNRIITIAIITVLVLLIIAVIWSKFR
jgi:Cu/Ag efflux pump CusA